MCVPVLMCSCLCVCVCMCVLATGQPEVLQVPGARVPLRLRGQPHLRRVHGAEGEHQVPTASLQRHPPQGVDWRNPS